MYICRGAVPVELLGFAMDVADATGQTVMITAKSTKMELSREIDKRAGKPAEVELPELKVGARKAA